MFAKTLWFDKVPIPGSKSPVKCVAISPDGSLLIAAVGHRVLLYNAEDGNLVESLRGHRDSVNAVDFNYDGSRFASGGSDNVVVLWKSNGEGLLKYNHSAPINSVKFHPSSMKLVSCTDIDFGIWSPEQKQVNKEKESSKILSSVWSTNGEFLAMGLQSGVICIRNEIGVEVQRFERRGPVRCLMFLSSVSTKAIQFNPGTLDGDALVAGSWDKVLSFYLITQDSHKLVYEKPLKFYPTCLSHAGSIGKRGNAFIISGSHQKCSVFSREGVSLFDVAVKASWIWTHAVHSASNRVILGTESGGIELTEIKYDLIYSYYLDKYAFQENLTEVIIQNLQTDKKVRIKCKDLIYRISLYKSKLAVQLSDRICIYETNQEDSLDMHYHLRKERISITETGCQNLLVMARHLIIVKDTTVELYTFDCIRERVWILDSPVVCVRNNGGPEGRESFVVGCTNGSVVKLYIDNPFVSELSKRPLALRCLDMNLEKTKLLALDTQNTLTITDLRSQQITFSASNVSWACFNTDIEDMISYSVGDQYVCVVSNFAASKPGTSGDEGASPTELRISGRLITLRGQKVYLHANGSLIGMEVPQSQGISRYIAQNDFLGAYRVACLGATENDWKLLARQSLRAGQLEVAKNSFSKFKDVKYLSLIENIEKNGALANIKAIPDSTDGSKGTIKSGPQATLDSSWLAEILAYEGLPLDAAKSYARLGKVDEAIRVLTDLKKFEDAKVFAQGAGYDTAMITNLTAQQAKWLQEIKDWKGAAELYMTLGEHLLGARIAGDSQEEGWDTFLLEIVRRTSVDSGNETLLYCAEKFEAFDRYEYAKETYQKLGDMKGLMQLYTKRKMWSEAVALAESQNGNFDSIVYLPYAHWLVSEDRYDEAIFAYNRAQRKDLGIKILMELFDTCIQEMRYKDGAYYAWVASTEHDSESERKVWQRKSDLYYAYSTIHSFITEPFTSYQSETLFQVARFILNTISSNPNDIPLGISEASTLYALGRESMNLSAFKLARQVYDRLSKLQLPLRKHEEIEFNMLVVQAKPVRDDPDLLPVCYRCSATNPLLNPFTDKFTGDVCTNCGHPFIRSFINFDILPLVEFVLQNGITEEEAIELIRQQPKASAERTADLDNKWKESKEGNSETMRMSRNDDYGKANEVDYFTRCLNRTLDKQVNKEYIPITVDVNTLLSLKRKEVFVCKKSSGKSSRTVFYRNMLPDIPIALSGPCNKFFHLEDFEFAYLSNKRCPYSRAKNVGDYGSL